MNWFLSWLFLHIAAAIIAFGTIFVFPLLERTMMQRPAGLGFAVLLAEKMERGLIIPVALTMLVSGTGLIFAAHLDFFRNIWLLVAILLYLTTLSIAVFIQVPTTAKLVHLTEEGVPPGPPPPEIQALLQRNKTFGMVLTALLMIIILLMVVKPGGLVAG